MIRCVLIITAVVASIGAVRAQDIRDGDLKPGDQPFFNLAFRTPGQSVTFMGGHTDEGKCERARVLLQRKLTKLRWGRATCLPQLQP